MHVNMEKEKQKDMRLHVFREIKLEEQLQLGRARSGRWGLDLIFTLIC